MQEREVKMILPAGTSLPAPSALLAGLGRWSVDEIEQDAVYFDTPGLALTRAGASLRYRSDDGWTVKVPRSHDDATFVRDEYGFAGERGEPPAAATDLVHVWVRSDPVREVAHLHTKRRSIHVFDEEGRPVVEVDEDDVAASVEGAPSTRFREVEVESTPEADPELVDALVKRLKRAGADPSDSQPKIARALGERASEPPDLPAPEPLRKSATIGELVRSSITAGVQRLLDHDPVVRVGEDAEGVHQARVATRRLRSDLRTFRPLMDTGWSEPLRIELSWLGELLGRVRDADVLLGLLAGKAGRLTETERAHANNLIDRLRATRDGDRSVLLDAMRSERYTMLLDRLVEAARAPRLRDELSNKRAKAVGRKLARRPVKRLRKQIRELSADPTDAELHEARKRAKQARYAFEAIAPVAGKGAARRARRLADLQSVLGDHQDTVVAVAWLHDAALDSPGSETPFVAGHLAGAFDADRTRLRDRWPRVWKRAERALP